MRSPSSPASASGTCRSTPRRWSNRGAQGGAVVRSFAYATALAASLAASGVSAQRDVTVPRPDLADTAAGTYRGDVISDSRGSSRSGVTITVTKSGPNTVQVVSSYDRLPTVST